MSEDEEIDEKDIVLEKNSKRKRKKLAIEYEREGAGPSKQKIKN